MKEWRCAIHYGVLVWMFTGFIGCAPVEPLPPPPSTPVSVSTFKSVMGKWAGILKTTPRLQRDDWVTFTIRDDGSYDFVSVRTIGIFRGQGTFTLIDGKLKAETEQGWTVATLYEEGAQRLMKVDGATKDGVQYSADLTPTK
ncbi:MAG TPA: hypothetical protein VES92_06245 [Nitrospiraceae bacterium]|nr:hypothetical protein [Nitrospiraceae bacterium]